MTCTPHLLGSSIILPHYTLQVCCVRDEGILESFDKTSKGLYKQTCPTQLTGAEN